MSSDVKVWVKVDSTNNIKYYHTKDSGYLEAYPSTALTAILYHGYINNIHRIQHAQERTQYKSVLKLALHEYKGNAKLSVMKAEVDHKKAAAEYMLQASATQALTTSGAPKNGQQGMEANSETFKTVDSEEPARKKAKVDVSLGLHG
jgi:hypothetical protein